MEILFSQRKTIIYEPVERIIHQKQSVAVKQLKKSLQVGMCKTLLQVVKKKNATLEQP